MRCSLTAFLVALFAARAFVVVPKLPPRGLLATRESDEVPPEWEENRKRARARRLSFVDERAKKRRSLIDAQRAFRQKQRAHSKKPPALDVTTSLADLQPGQWLDGVVRKTRPNGAFVTVGAETDGFLHAKDVSETEFIEDCSRALQPGDRIRVCVKWATNSTLALSVVPLRQTHLAHNELDIRDFQVDQAIQDAVVVRCTPYAAFLDVGCTTPAYLHVADIGLKPRMRIGAPREPIISPRPGLTVPTCWIKAIDLGRNRLRVTCIPPHLRDDPHIKPPPKPRPWLEKDEEE